jgi:hypothetical protein
VENFKIIKNFVYVNSGGNLVEYIIVKYVKLVKNRGDFVKTGKDKYQTIRFFGLPCFTGFVFLMFFYIFLTCLTNFIVVKCVFYIINALNIGLYKANGFERFLSVKIRYFLLAKYPSFEYPVLCRCPILTNGWVD